MSKDKFEIITLKKKNISDFALERNSLLKKANAEWVFFLDSDEKMPKRLKDEIERKIASGGFNGFYVYRKNYFLGRYSGTDKILRLGKKNSGVWKRAVHETWDIKGKIGVLDYPIIHNTANTVSEMIFKMNNYSGIHARENIKEGKKANLFKIIFYPKFKFIQSLIGGRGLVMSILQAFHSFLSWSKQWELQK